MIDDEDDEFLRTIPPFLRRTEAHPAHKPAQRPRRVAQPQPAPAPKPEAAPRPAAVTPTHSVTRQRTRLELAFRNDSFGDGSEDVSFEVDLPRSVVAQIRTLAADRTTSERAVLLRALRLAGLSVPEGSDTTVQQETARRRPA